jgi:DNA topoisomerase I
MPTLEAALPEMRATPAPKAPLPEGMRYTQKMVKKLGLRYVGIEALTLSRRRRGKSFSYHRADGSAIRDPRIVLRLKSLAVPRPTRMSFSPRTRRRISRRSGGMPPAACNTAIIPNG